jgi:hypothetical protein
MLPRYEKLLGVYNPDITVERCDVIGIGDRTTTIRKSIVGGKLRVPI